MRTEEKEKIVEDYQPRIVRSDNGLFSIKTHMGVVPKALRGSFTSEGQARKTLDAYRAEVHRKALSNMSYYSKYELRRGRARRNSTPAG